MFCEMFFKQEWISRTDISICVYVRIDNYANDFVFINSREGYYAETYAPQLIWIYEKAEETPFIPGYNLLILTGMVSVITVFMVLKKRFRNEKI